MLKLFLVAISALFLSASDVRVQVLGSGGPEISNRASSGYIVWINGKSRLLVDCGGGVFLRFAQSGAKLEDLDAIVLTHNHADHTADLSAFAKAVFFSARTRPLIVYGASGNAVFPSTDEFVQRLLGKDGAYPYLSDMLTIENTSFQIIPRVLSQEKNTITMKEYELHSMGVHHGIVPALAFRVDVCDKSIVFTGDTNNHDKSMEKFALNADVAIADHAIPQNANEVAVELHMEPSVIADMAHQAKVKHLVLSHIMKRSEPKLAGSIAIIKKQYGGKITVAQDLMVLEL